MRKRISLQQNLINHVCLVLDASASMRGKEKDVIRVADEIVADLKEKSQAYGQETRMTMYIFGSDTQAACYDVDVLRTPTIANLYEATGLSTALIDASSVAIQDMQKTATLYGDHAFLMYVITDGYENASHGSPTTLNRLLTGLPIEWTVAAFVPDRMSQTALVNCGFSLENTMIWNVASAQGVVDIGQKIRETSTNYMQMRSSGVRGTRNLFSLDTKNLTPDVVSHTMVEVPPTSYFEFKVDAAHTVIKDAVQSQGTTYKIGSTFYQLTKTEEIQPQKRLAVREKTTGKLFTGQTARQILGVPDFHAKVAPASHPQYDIFVQSTSPNRKLVPNTTAIVFK